jgi:hypothetical protein
MPIKLNSTGGGSVSIDVPSTASTYTLTAPARSGTIITNADANTVTQAMVQTGFAGNGPAFSAYQSSSQTLSSATWAKLQLQTEEFDTANCFDSTTNYRFTPNVAGYYFFTASFAINSSATNAALAFYKNGSQYKWPVYINASAGNVTGASCLAYANGTTDYFEVWVYAATGQGLYAAASTTFFQGHMVRSA